MTPQPIRKKAWERGEERGFYSRVAERVGKTPSAIRKYCLPPDHKDRRPLVDPELQAELARLFDLQPNDFVWLHGERGQRRRAARLAREAIEMAPLHAKADKIMAAKRAEREGKR